MRGEGAVFDGASLSPAFLRIKLLIAFRVLNPAKFASEREEGGARDRDRKRERESVKASGGGGGEGGQVRERAALSFTALVRGFTIGQPDEGLIPDPDTVSANSNQRLLRSRHPADVALSAWPSLAR